MKRIIVLLLCACLLLTACKNEPEQTEPSTEATTAPTTQATTEATTAPTTEATTAPTEETTVPTEPPLLYQHPLTGEMMAQPLLNRPIAISTNNYSPAQPVLGISHADIVFEHMTEGGGVETRMLAIYTDLNFDDQLGSIRSARTYSIEMAKSVNAPLVHCGGSYLAMDILNKGRYPSFDEMYHAKYFYRDSDRLAAGYSREHTLVTEGNLLLKGLEEEAMFELPAAEDAFYGYTFSDTPTAGDNAAKTVTAQFNSTSGKITIMTYDETDGVYYGQQKWSRKQADIADGNTMDLVPFKNIVIIKVWVTGAGNGINVLMDMTSGGDGYFICNGTYVPIKWGRDSNNCFTYTLEDGSPVTFGVGKTYVLVLPINSPDVIFE